MDVHKRGFTAYDDKRVLLPDLAGGKPNRLTHAYGHFSLADVVQVDDEPEEERAIAGHDMVVDELEPRPPRPILTAGQKRESRTQRKHKKAVKTAQALRRDELADFNPDMPVDPNNEDIESIGSDQDMEEARVHAMARPGAGARLADAIANIEARVNPDPVEEFLERTTYPPGM